MMPTQTIPESAADEIIQVGNIDSLSASSAILIDLTSGRCLWEDHADQVLPPASITKLMTLLLVIEAEERGEIYETDVVTASEHACSMGGAQIYLKVGEQMTVEELFKAVSIASANDAAVALAEYVAGSEDLFVARMNARAAELGMTNTTYQNACGLDDEGHVTTARDIARLSAELCKHEKAFAYSTTWMDSVRGGAFQLVNTNKLIRTYPGLTGLKTGSTSKAKCCLSATAERSGVRLCAVVMGCPNSAARFSDAAALLDYGFATYVSVPLADPCELEIAGLPVKCGTEETVPLKICESDPVLVERASINTITRTIHLPEAVEAPIRAGDTLGEIRVTCDGREIGCVDLIADADVERLSVWMAFVRLLSQFRLSD